jgi:hypothetical protein
MHHPESMDFTVSWTKMAVTYFLISRKEMKEDGIFPAYPPEARIQSHDHTSPHRGLYIG